MSWIIYFLIGLGILLIGLIIISIIIMSRIRDKTRIRINILLKSKRWTTFKVKVKKLGKEITYEDESYIFDEKCLIKGKWIDNIYYYQGNPSPINFDFNTLTPNTYNAKDLKTILDSDLIEKLFSEKRIARMEMIMYIILGVTAIALLGVIGSFFVPVNITSETNQIFIENIFKQILTGGL